jgi:3-methyladenine DNA glycosylase AlkC
MEPLKNGYSREYLERLASAIARQHPAKFNRRQFLQNVFDDEWERRELKARLQHIRHCLHQHLHLPYTDALTVLMAAAPEFGGYHAILFPDYVESYGFEHWQPSMKALAHFTQYSSSEFAVRPFLVKDPQRMLKQMQRWSRDRNEHLRRLSSEGTRPRLPWAMALPQFKRDPLPLLPILDQLHADPSLYVRKSVANNLNDIAKDNPQVTLDWAARFRGAHTHTDWIIKRACRTLLKRADAQALDLFAFAEASHVAVKNLTVHVEHLRIGDTLEFEFVLASRPTSKSASKSASKPAGAKLPLGRLRIEYGIDYVKANGQHARKIFQIAEGDFEEISRSFRKKHSLRQMTTRVHYAGEHRLAIVINGKEVAIKSFQLT